MIPQGREILSLVYFIGMPFVENETHALGNVLG
jgi:hypothetical protein